MSNNTYQILLNWDKGNPAAERMSAQLLKLEGYEKIDPQHPLGGPDQKKDIICYKHDRKYIAACYFPTGEQSFTLLKNKFNKDIEGVKKNEADGFIFITNQKITQVNREKFVEKHKFSIDIYHNERILTLLNAPAGYGIRLEYLNIPLSEEEQISFFSQQNSFIEQTLNVLNKTTNSILETMQKPSPPSEFYFPIAGINFSSRIAIEDIFAIQKAVLDQTQAKGFFYGFRTIDVWVGNTQGDKTFNPPTFEKVPQLTYELIKWWRDKYMEIVYSTEEEKISAIAAFHAKFLYIHPFVDGNGRAIRIITSIQCKDLLNKNIYFQKMDRKSYYNALELYDNNQITELNNLFRTLIK